MRSRLAFGGRLVIADAVEQVGPRAQKWHDKRLANRIVVLVLRADSESDFVMFGRHEKRAERSIPDR